MKLVIIVNVDISYVSVKKFSVFSLDPDNKRGFISTFLQNMYHLQPFCQLSQRAACRAVRSHTSLVHALVRLHRDSLHHLPHDVLKSLADGLIGPTSPLGIHGIPFLVFHGCDELYHGFRPFLAPAPSLMFHAIAVYTMARFTRSGLYQMDVLRHFSLIQWFYIRPVSH